MVSSTSNSIIEVEEQILEPISKLLTLINYNDEVMSKITLKSATKKTDKFYLLKIIVSDFYQKQKSKSFDVIYYDRDSSLCKIQDLNKMFSSSLSEKLLEMNLKQIKVDKYNFISDTVPSIKEASDELKKLSVSIRNFVNYNVVGKMTSVLDEQQINYQDIYGIRLSSPRLVSNKFPLKDDTIITVEAEIVDKFETSVIQSVEIKSKIKYTDYRDLNWLYEKQGISFDDDKIHAIIEDAFSSLDSKTKISNGEQSVYLLKYAGLRQTDMYIVDENKNEHLVNFMKIKESGLIDDIVENVVATTDNVLTVRLKAQDKNSINFTIILGNNGITSLSGQIYNPKNKNTSSLSKAKTSLIRIIGQSDSIDTLLSSYDERKKIITDKNRR